ncbi:MAG TPA: DMT family transporter [Streptosporangiaceae bacterium]|nr:DMT family transporter [Streptosporangiaceae bacterium]
MGLLAQPAAIAIALCAAVCFAIAMVLQQRVAAQLPATSAFDTRVLLHLARRPLWLVGFVAVIFSISLQAAALGLGRLVIIEPVLASSLLFALALAAWADRRRMRAGEWAAALATFAGLAVFLVASQPSGGRPTANSGLLALAAAGAFCFAAAATLVAIRLSPVRRALVLGIGGGAAAGVTDALTKSVAFLAGSREFGVFADPRLYLLVVVGLMTYTIQQNGYRAASLAAFLPAFAVLDPAVGSVLGLTIYHERLGGGAIRIGIESLAVIAATWGIARLAKSSSATGTAAKPGAIPGTVPAPEPVAVAAGAAESRARAQIPAAIPAPEPVPVSAAASGHIAGLLPAVIPRPVVPDLSPPSVATD